MDGWRGGGIEKEGEKDQKTIRGNERRKMTRVEKARGSEGRLKTVGGKERGNELGLSPPARERAWRFPPNSVGSTRFSLPLYS